MSSEFAYVTLENLIDLREWMELGPIRDIGLLESAVHRPQAQVFGIDAYPDLFEKAAALLHSLLKNHVLLDGNKRIAWAATFMFLDMNGHEIVATRAKALTFLLDTAAGDGDLDSIAEWLRTNTEKNDRH